MSKPLEHITILDLSRVLACPFASMILAELGATVIKVEQPGCGDETRSFEPRVEAEGGSESAYYMAFNRSKQSITVNLRSEAGQQIVRDLAANVDVVIENFPVGTLKRYGLGPETLREINPKLVYLSCTGFGQTGPYAPRKGYDTVFQAMGGIMSLTGERDGGPVKPGLPVADLTSGLWAAIAVLSALQGRSASGQGCHIDLSMFDAQVSLLTLAAARWFALQEVPQRMGTEHPGRVPSASFQAACGRWLHITASDQHWEPLRKVLKLETWGADPELQTNVGRVRRRDEVMRRLTDAVAACDRDELCAAMDAAGVPAGPIKSVDEVLSDPHVLARGMVANFDHPVIGQFPALPVPLRFDGWDNPEVGRPPLLGEHTGDVLRERLGMDAQRVKALREAKAI
ncbi:CaiB/BaiF CoA-transferase family protein [Cupriavidus basilensis]|uniref:CaiB/BaiF CoA-transferase family protein n=1 Tax=Cupriavidus basilensis TaxID=68895 RepID=A0ABT6AQT8_9BURK|nr:CaiB/BaiF CoA-transferase family protein [Cupriavidus basilensis]MDF3834990.1 CaiB/BaiF CoA-transferase family protein [Cupriavidus basilensis]